MKDNNLMKYKEIKRRLQLWQVLKIALEKKLKSAKTV